ncbi:MAG: S8 family serine peptidase [Deltaproteobacteria bacterium]|nr:S8 family serine peptidase [Deltaproteobacteria bacterium]
MSAPVVSGAVALLREAHPRWSPTQVKLALKQTATHLGYSVDAQGAGLINATSALRSSALSVWDIDGDDGVQFNDALWAMRYLFGHRGESLAQDLTNNFSSRSTAQIEFYLERLKLAGLLDIDGDATFDALTDGVLLGRYILGFREERLVDGAVSLQATRDAAQIVDFIETAIHPSYPFLPLDIDVNSIIDANTDGYLVILYASGFGPSQYAPYVGSGSRRSVNEIHNYLSVLDQMGALDIDGDGRVLAGSDGILIARYLSGIRGEQLIDGAIESSATRTTAEQIVAFIENISIR